MLEKERKILSAVTIILVLVAATPLVSSLQCCQCYHFYDYGTQCKCLKTPEQKDCSNDHINDLRGAMINGTDWSQMRQGGGGDNITEVCAKVSGTLAGKNIPAFGRINAYGKGNFSNETCTLVPDPFDIISPFGRIYVDKACYCTEEWCNCKDPEEDPGPGAALQVVPSCPIVLLLSRIALAIFYSLSSSR